MRFPPPEAAGSGEHSGGDLIWQRQFPLEGVLGLRKAPSPHKFNRLAPRAARGLAEANHLAACMSRPLVTTGL